MPEEYKLVIVESPSKAKTISKYLGKGFLVKATVGHIIDLSKGKGSSIGVNIEDGFKPVYTDLLDKKDVIQAIVSSAKSAKEVIIASDPDREGEAIAFHVYDKVKKFNKPIKRAEFHEITKAGVKKGLENLRELDNDLYDAQQSRRVLDRIVGFMVSPYLIKKMGDKLSAGRVQSVALRMIVDRENEIKAFNPEDFWNISVKLSKDSDVFTANYPSKIKSANEAKSIENDLANSTYTITNVAAKEQVRSPYPPFSTADLQKTASAKLRFGAERTMKAAQSLYESGNITYIRSDSYRSSPESIAEVRSYIADSGFDVPTSPVSYTSKGSSQDAHEAIRPTDVTLDPDSFAGDPDQEKLYKLIWQRFVASQMKPALYDTVAVTIEAGKHTLKSNGKSLRYKGWLSVYFEKDKSKDLVLPSLSKSDELTLKDKVSVVKKSTKPPGRFNDGTIIDGFEKKGIGRPSTYAAIITKISGRKYVDKEDNTYKPTDLGMQVTEDLVKHFSFMSYDFTSSMESMLDDMALGKIDYQSVMKHFYKPFKLEYQKAKNSEGRDAGVECPNCASPMTVRHSQYGFFAGCIFYPDCKGVVGVRLENDKIIVQPKHEKIDDVECPRCKSPMVRRDGKYGPFYSCSDYPICAGKRKIPFGKKCDKCSDEMYLTVFDGKPKLACMGYPKCKNIMDPPEGVDLKWAPPKDIAVQDIHRKVERVLKKKVNYDE